MVALITGSECHRTAGRRERAELDGMVIEAILRATWNNASSSRLHDEVQPRRGMSDFDAAFSQAIDSFFEFSFPNFSQRLRRQA